MRYVQKSIFYGIVPVVNELSNAFGLDAIYIIGMLFTLESIRSRYVKYPLYALFEDSPLLSKQSIPTKRVKKGGFKRVMFDADDFVNFVCSKRQYKKYEHEKEHVLSTFERLGLGKYHRDKNIFEYYGNKTLLNIIRAVVNSFKEGVKHENIH